MKGFKFQTLDVFKNPQYCTGIELCGVHWFHLRFTLDDDTMAAYLTDYPWLQDPSDDDVHEFVTEQNILYARNADTLKLGFGRTMVSPTPPGTAFSRSIDLRISILSLTMALSPQSQTYHNHWLGDEDFFVLGLGEESRLYASFND